MIKLLVDMNAAIIELGQTANLQQSIEDFWAEGIRSFELRGIYRAEENTYTILRIGKHLSGIVLQGSGVLDGCGRTSHVVVIEDAGAIITGLTLARGDTTDPSRVGKDYRGSPFRSIYEVIDGAGLLILGNSEVKLEECSIRDNHSGMCGGGLSNQGTGLVEVEKCSFKKNSAYHTGGALDNLTHGSRLAVKQSCFRDNISNVGSIWGGPHGQITIFDDTQATIQECDFSGHTFPIDAVEGSYVQSSGNTYNNLPTEPVQPGKKGSLVNKFRHVKCQSAYTIRLLHLGIYPWVRLH